ncbi:MAG TPA: 2-amino-4-hydroxy-6-hydroxymethyldihydropteridine diphosphokinase [Caulobacteraceae bacterium]|jgi:2-amino-4-hydroxy-6-hydroxymethyldihydropteridine diphosphokinase
MGYNWQMKPATEKPPPWLAPDWLDSAVVVALGSNQSGPFASSISLLEAAFDRLSEVGFRPIVRSRWWRSKAWPNPANPEFINGVALLLSDAPPRDTLASLNEVEREFARIREGANEPRTLDLDLIAHGRTVIDSENLILPHPRAHERLFVMGPLAEVAPSWRHPRLGESAQALVGRAKIGADAKPMRRAALHKNL